MLGLGPLHFGRHPEPDQLALLAPDPSPGRAIARSLAPVGAGAAVPPPRSLARAFVIVLSELADLAAEVAREIASDRRYTDARREVVVELGVARPVPTAALALRVDAKPLGSAGVIADQVPGEVDDQPSKLLDLHRRHDLRVGVQLPAPDVDNEAQLARLLALGGGLGRRLDATVAAHWRERLLAADAEINRVRARLHAALYGRVLSTLGGWLGQREVALALELAPEAASPSLRRAADGSLAAALPFGWLVEVWARGLEVVWGRFCLTATTTDGHEWKLRTVGPELDEPTTLTVTLPD